MTPKPADALPPNDVRQVVSRLAPTPDAARLLESALDAPLRLTPRQRAIHVGLLAVRTASIAALLLLLAIWTSAPLPLAVGVILVALAAEVGHARVPWAMPGGDVRFGPWPRRLMVVGLLWAGAAAALGVTGRLTEALVVLVAGVVVAMALTLSGVAAAPAATGLPTWPAGAEAVGVLARLAHVLGWTRVPALADQCGLAPSALESRLAELTSAGLVRRRGDKVNLTPAGRAWLTRLRAELEQVTRGR